MRLAISAYSSINSDEVSKNGVTILKNLAQEPFNDFAKAVYKAQNLSYPKFYKMDELCKLAFLGAEILLTGESLEREGEGEDIAIILANKNSSIASDKKHCESFQDRNNYFPSPAIFVYTLPNIMLGELCIRHQITGENSCFLMDKINPGFLFRYVNDLFENDHYKYCITGWVDYCDKAYEANLFLIEKKNGEKSYISDFNENFYNVIAY